MWVVVDGWSNGLKYRAPQCAKIFRIENQPKLMLIVLHAQGDSIS